VAAHNANVTESCHGSHLAVIISGTKVSNEICWSIFRWWYIAGAVTLNNRTTTYLHCINANMHFIIFTHCYY